MNKKYEVTVVFDKDAKDMSKVLEKYMKDSGAKITKQDDWGVKPLAYSIKKRDEAQYVYFEIEAEPKQAKDLENRLRLEESLLRHLIVKA